MRVKKLPPAEWLTDPVADIACACFSAIAFSLASSVTAGIRLALR